MTQLLAQRKPLFTIKQFDRLSNILDNAGQVVLGVVVIGPFFSTQSINAIIMILGLMAIISLWSLSIAFARRKEP